MGTGIHNMADVRHEEVAWHAVIDDPEQGPRSVPDIWCDHYPFAVSAGVRNDGDIVPIPPPRRVAKEVSCPCARAVVTQVAGHWRDRSWVTLAEFEPYDWGEDGFPSILEELGRGGSDASIPKGPSGETAGHALVAEGCGSPGMIG